MCQIAQGSAEYASAVNTIDTFVSQLPDWRKWVRRIGLYVASRRPHIINLFMAEKETFDVFLFNVVPQLSPVRKPNERIRSWRVDG